LYRGGGPLSGAGRFPRRQPGYGRGRRRPRTHRRPEWTRSKLKKYKAKQKKTIYKKKVEAFDDVKEKRTLPAVPSSLSGNPVRFNDDLIDV